MEILNAIKGRSQEYNKYAHINIKFQASGTNLYWANGPEKVLQLNFSCRRREALYGHSTAPALRTPLTLPGGHRTTSTHLTSSTSAPARNNNLHQCHVWEKNCTYEGKYEKSEKWKMAKIETEPFSAQKSMLWH